jgi:hypothetical protein
VNARAGYPLAPERNLRLLECTLERAEEDDRSVRNQLPACQQPVSQPRHLRQRQVFRHRRYQCSSANPRTSQSGPPPPRKPSTTGTGHKDSNTPDDHKRLKSPVLAQNGHRKHGRNSRTPPPRRQPSPENPRSLCSRPAPPSRYPRHSRPEGGIAPRMRGRGSWNRTPPPPRHAGRDNARNPITPSKKQTQRTTRNTKAVTPRSNQNA